LNIIWLEFQEYTRS